MFYIYRSNDYMIMLYTAVLFSSPPGPSTARPACPHQVRVPEVTSLGHVGALQGGEPHHQRQERLADQSGLRVPRGDQTPPEAQENESVRDQ